MTDAHAIKVSATRVDSAELKATETEAIETVKPKGGTAKRRTLLLKIGAAVLLAGALSAAIAVPLATSGGGLGYDEGVPVLLTPFESCSHLSTSLQLWPGYFADEELQLSARYSSSGFRAMPMEAMSATVSATASGTVSDSGGASRSKGGSESFSSTNVQVGGVDESDIVKNNGQYIYSIGGRELVVVRAYPAEDRAVLSRTDISAGVAADVFAAEEALLAGDVLAIFAAAQLVDVTTGRRFAALLVQTWDVNQPQAPTLVATNIIEGTLVTARLIGSFAYVAISSSAHLPTYPRSVPDDGEVMPLMQSAGGGEMLPLTGCTNVSYVSEVQPRSLLTITSVSMSSTAGGGVGTMVSQQTLATGSSYRSASVYASQNSIYIASYNPTWSCESNGRQCPGNDWWCSRLSNGGCVYRVSTAIAAFSISDGHVTLRSLGRVPGYLLSQWSMDEYDSHLRVAYTRTSGSSSGRRPTTENAVDVLDASTLRRVGRLSGLGRGERIYSVRFVGSVGYMVTFRQIDPLYTLALGDPSAPRVHGELKIPGYSDYLHPVDNETILGVGRAGSDDGALRGVKLALFDVSDLSSPRQVADIELGGRGSETPIEDDHRALLYDPTRRLLVIPVIERHGYSCDPPSFSGAKVYTLGSTSFDLRAEVEHGPNRSDSWDRDYNCYSACQASRVRRSLYVGNGLFTISDSEVRVLELDTFSHSWNAPLHSAQALAREGSCELDGHSLPWSRAAASGPDIWCGSLSSRRLSESKGVTATPAVPPTSSHRRRASHNPSCGNADRSLRNAECVSYSARRTLSAYLEDAKSCCGTEACASGCNTSFNPCRVWW